MKLLYLFLLTFAITQAAAQQKFIEVNASDTVLAEANFFVYKITIVPEENFENDEVRFKNATLFMKIMERQKTKEKRLYDSILLILKRNGFRFLNPSTADSFNISANPYKRHSAEIILHSTDSLSALFQLLKNIKQVEGSVEMTKTKDEAMYKKALYKKLVDQASDKAKSIAAYTGQSIGSVVSVVENKPGETETAGWTAYPPLSAVETSVIPGWHTTTKLINYIINDAPVNNKYIISGSLTVRFSIQ